MPVFTAMMWSSNSEIVGGESGSRTCNRKDSTAEAPSALVTVSVISETPVLSKCRIDRNIAVRAGAAQRDFADRNERLIAGERGHIEGARRRLGVLNARTAKTLTTR